jgi:1-phosphofructokinase
MIYTIDLNPSLDRTLHYARLTLGEVNRALSARTDLSGKGVNVATALRRLGIEAPIVGLAGGATGRVLDEGLAAAGYGHSFVPVAGETRCNITVIDDATGVTTKLNERGPEVSSDDLAAFETLLLCHVRLVRARGQPAARRP